MIPNAMAHRIPVETPKPSKEQGTYLHPELYGQPASKGVSGVAHLPHLPMVTQPAR